VGEQFKPQMLKTFGPVTQDQYRNMLLQQFTASTQWQLHKPEQEETKNKQ
jgi:hypothetical protein